MYTVYIQYFKNADGTINTSSTPTKMFEIPLNNTNGFPVDSPSVTGAEDSADTFDFQMNCKSPYYDALIQLKTRIRVEYDGDVIFFGRVLTVNASTVFHNKSVHCEGAYSFMNDTQYEGVPEKKQKDIEHEDYLTDVINNHNTMVDDDIWKKIYRGTTTIDGTTSWTPTTEKRKYKPTSWSDTMSLIRNDINEFGGHALVKYNTNDNKLYLNWYKHYARDLGNGNRPVVSIGRNILDISSNNDIDNIFTYLIPIGGSDNAASTTYVDGYVYTDKNGMTHTHSGKAIPVTLIPDLFTEQQLTDEFHSPSDYATAKADYGVIYKTESFPDARKKSDLWNKAVKWIKESYYGLANQFTVKAVDMHVVNGSLPKILLGDCVDVYYMIYENGTLVQKYKKLVCKNVRYDLFNPENNSYTFGIPSEILKRSYSNSKKTASNNIGGGGKKPPPDDPKDPEVNFQTIAKTILEYHDSYDPDTYKYGGADAYNSFIANGELLGTASIYDPEDTDYYNHPFDHPEIYFTVDIVGRMTHTGTTIWVGVSEKRGVMAFYMSTSPDKPYAATSRQGKYNYVGHWYSKDPKDGVNFQIKQAVMGVSGLTGAATETNQAFVEGGIDVIASLADDQVSNWIASVTNQGVSLGKGTYLLNTPIAELGLDTDALTSNTVAKLKLSTLSSGGTKNTRIVASSVDGTIAVSNGNKGSTGTIESTISGEGIQVMKLLQAGGQPAAEIKATTVSGSTSGAIAVFNQNGTKTVEQNGSDGSAAFGAGGDLNGWKVTVNRPTTYTADGKTHTVPANSIAADDIHFTKTYDSLKVKLLKVDELIATKATITELDAVAATVETINANYITASDLTAGNLTVTGTTKLGDVMTIISGAVGFSAPAIFSGNITIENNGSALNLHDLNFVGGSTYSMSPTVVGSMIKEVSKDDTTDEVTLLRFDGTKVTFRKAASGGDKISSSWSGNVLQLDVGQTGSTPPISMAFNLRFNQAPSSDAPKYLEVTSTSNGTTTAISGTQLPCKLGYTTAGTVADPHTRNTVVQFQKHSSGAQVSGSPTLALSGYWDVAKKAGWTAAYNSVDGHYPTVENLSNNYIDAPKPNTTVDGAAQYLRYYVTVDSTGAYIRYTTNSGTRVAKASVDTILATAYNNGWGSAYGSVDGNYPTAVSTNNYIDVPKPNNIVDGAAQYLRYYVTVDSTGAYVRYLTNSGTKVAKASVADVISDAEAAGYASAHVTGGWSNNVFTFSKTNDSTKPNSDTVTVSTAVGTYPGVANKTYAYATYYNTTTSTYDAIGSTRKQLTITTVDDNTVGLKVGSSSTPVLTYAHNKYTSGFTAGRNFYLYAVGWSSGTLTIGAKDSASSVVISGKTIDRTLTAGAASWTTAGVGTIPIKARYGTTTPYTYEDTNFSVRVQMSIDNNDNNSVVLKHSGNETGYTFTHGKYDSGWGAAYTSVSTKYPTTTDTSNNYMQVPKPNSAVDGAATYLKYYVTVDSTGAYIRYNKTSGKKVAKASVDTILTTAYNNGWGAAYGSVNTYYPTTESTDNYIEVPKPNNIVDGAAQYLRYYVTVDSTGAYVRYSTDSGTKVAKASVNTILTTAYNNGWGAAYNSVDGDYPTTEDLSDNYIEVPKPNSTVDGATQHLNYYVTVDNTGAYIRYLSATGTRVAKASVADVISDAETAGKNAVTLNDPSWAHAAPYTTSATNTVTVSTNGRPTQLSKDIPVTIVEADTWTNNKKNVDIQTTDGDIVARKEIDASTVYSTGETNGKAAVTLNDPVWAHSTDYTSGTTNTVTVSTNGRPTQLSKDIPVTITQAGWSNNKKIVTITTTNGAIVASDEVDASGIYSTGETNGKAAVTLNDPVWTNTTPYTEGITNTVTVSTNGRPTQLSKAIPVTLVQSAWSNNKKTVDIQTTNGVVVARAIVDASSIPAPTVTTSTGAWVSDGENAAHRTVTVFQGGNEVTHVDVASTGVTVGYLDNYSPSPKRYSFISGEGTANAVTQMGWRISFNNTYRDIVITSNAPTTNAYRDGYSKGYSDGYSDGGGGSSTHSITISTNSAWHTGSGMSEDMAKDAAAQSMNCKKTSLTHITDGRFMNNSWVWFKVTCGTATKYYYTKIT